MNPKLLGFLRGLGYALVFAILHYAAQNLGSVLDTTTSALIVGVVGLIDHALGDPNPLGSTPKQQ